MPNQPPQLAQPSALADSLKRAWRAGAPPDAAAALRDHPELLDFRSLVVDLAYEEYCLREEAGEPPDAEDFCRRLPAFESQVREVIRGHREIADNPELFEKPEATWPAPGETVEGLSVVRELGRGAFARAYLGTDPDTGDRPVVLKLAPSPSVEARTVGPLSHPHIVAVHWAKRVRGLHAMCMPFVGAATLADAISAAFRRDRPASDRSARTVLAAASDAEGARPAEPVLTGRESYPTAVAAVGARLADALAYLHRAGVCHGDLKPSNIILGAGGHPYLIDFNLSSRTTDSLLRAGGTLPYMAPERLRLVRGEKTEPPPPAPADVYSLGAILYESLTGKLPFHPLPDRETAKVADDLLARQSAGLPPEAWPGVPRALAAVARRCLAVDPRERPGPEQVERWLTRYVRRWARLKQLLLGGATAAGVLVLGGQALAGPPVPGVEFPDVAAYLTATPTTADQFFTRGVFNLGRGDGTAARDDFDRARQLKPDGKILAFHAYSIARSVRADDLETAQLLYREAVERYKYDRAWVRSNRAECLVRLGKPERLREAVREATAALAIDSGLRAARLNRAHAWFLLQTEANPPVPAPPDCADDVLPAMLTGPYTADLYYKAALILAACAGEREDLRGTAVKYLVEAVKLGKHPKSLGENPIFKKHLAGRPDFAAALDLPRGEPGPALNPFVLDPLTQDHFGKN